MKKSLLMCIMFLIILIIFPSCDIFKKIVNEDYGAYTSITIRVTVTYRGLNSKGIRKLTFDSNVVVNEIYKIGGEGDMNAQCEDQILDRQASFDITINTNTLSVFHQLINWDYLNWNNNGVNIKNLCTIFEGSIVNYTYEDGKDDPGSPVIGGWDVFNNPDFDSICQEVSFRVDTCEISGEISFTSPYVVKGLNRVISQSNKVKISTGDN